MDLGSCKPWGYLELYIQALSAKASCLHENSTGQEGKTSF